MRKTQPLLSGVPFGDFKDNMQNHLIEQYAALARKYKMQDAARLSRERAEKNKKQFKFLLTLIMAAITAIALFIHYF